ncbi:hypothetical protein N7504_006799 [Penicillium tannophilum]|nr:hypothetical protein N7504_006799 [Penicillium tannophilum]
MTLRSRSVQSPLYPIGLRSDHIAEFERLLWIEPKYDSTSADEYIIRFDSDDSTLITVTGKCYYRHRPVREFRDASGLPMFEVRRGGWHWLTPAWRIRLPGNETGNLAYVKPVGWRSEFDLTFRNALAPDAKNDDEKMVTLEVRYASPFCGFGIWVGGRKVADVRQSMEKNRTIRSLLGGPSYNPPRAIMEVLVADGFDFSLASLCAIIVCDEHFRSTPPSIFETKERAKRLNPKMVS